MNRKPLTLKEAREVTYGHPTIPRAFREGGCAYTIYGNWVTPFQCSRKSGHGPGNLYCKQHAKKVENTI